MPLLIIYYTSYSSEVFDNFPAESSKDAYRERTRHFLGAGRNLAFEGKSSANRVLGHLYAESQKAALCGVVPVSAACFYVVLSSSVRFMKLLSFLSKVKTVSPFSEWNAASRQST